MHRFIFSTLIIAITAVYGQRVPLYLQSSVHTIICPEKASQLCGINKTCEFTCHFSCLNVKREIIAIGSSTYLTNSSVCRSALHDLRISLDNKKKDVKIRTFYKKNCSLEGSVRYGFSSVSFQNDSCEVFEFVSLRVSEDILDMVSMHSNYLYSENENHTQVCVTTDDPEGKFRFGVYAKWNKPKMAIEVSKTDYESRKEELFQYTHVWSDAKSAGFQCFFNTTALSIITSVALQKDASFRPNSLTVTMNKYEDVVLSMDEVGTLDEDTEWKKDDKKILLKLNDKINRTRISLMNVHEGSSGIYSLSYKNTTEKPGFVQLIVRTCPQNKFGDNCSESCPTCLNGGICHDITGKCVCAPGFNGSSCEKACEPGYLGKMCNIKCIGNTSTESQLCKGLSICLPNPYGCSCASGFTGLFCDKECPDHTYGAGCLQQHKHVHYKPGSCDKFCDSCDCRNGWHGESCNESYPVLSSPPSLINVTKNSITLSFSEWSNITDKGSGTPTVYEVVYKETGDESIRTQNVSAKTENETFEVQLQFLKPGTQYSVGVIVIDTSCNKQEMDIKFLDATTSCDTPSAPPSDIELFYEPGDKFIHVEWKLPPPENWNCWDVNIMVKAREMSTNITKECMKKGNACSFYSDPFETWIIQVCASSNGSEENCAKLKNISTEGTVSSTPIKVDVIERETSLSLTWIPPAYTEKLSFYNISHKDMSTSISKSVQIQIQDAGCESNKGNYHCSTINNLIPGHTYKIEIVAVYNNKERIVIGNFEVSLETPPIALSLILGVCLPLVVIICIIALILFMQKRKKIKSSLKVKFFPYKIESEFAACNEALDEMDVIETESMNEEITNPIPLEELQEYVKQSIQNIKIRKEFMSVPTGQIYPCNVAKLGENKPKNRYGNILPYDHSRVVLDVVDEDPFSNYIHASYVHGYNKVKKYIATQGPLPNTVNDFWRMLWNEGSCKILMMTNFMENGKYKCEKYWAEDSCTYEDINVSLEDSKSYADFVIRTFKVSKDKISREVKQFHFTTWPDHGAPSNVTPFGVYLKKAHSYKPDSDAPIIIHCSAGIGRTGTAILLDSMIDMAHQEKKVDLVSHLCSMRKQRMNIVENYDQYVFVYCALVEELCFEDTILKSSDFKKEFERLKTVDRDSEITFIEKQFQALNQLTVELMYKGVQGAYQQENQSKNRCMEILPPDRARPFLSRDSSAYINAVFVDSFTVKNAYIATQYPLPGTVDDFWSMVYEQKSKLVVLLQEMNTFNEETPQLWLPDGIQTFDDFEVSCQSVTSENEIIVANIIISIKDEEMKEPLSVNIVVLKQWACDTNLPVETSVVLSAITKVHSLNSESPSTITTICLDGVTACGIFCACLYICDHIKTEQEIDIFRAVKCIRTNRPHFISNLAQYEFMFDVVSSYMDSLGA